MPPETRRSQLAGLQVLWFPVSSLLLLILQDGDTAGAVTLLLPRKAAPALEKGWGKGGKVQQPYKPWGRDTQTGARRWSADSRAEFSWESTLLPSHAGTRAAGGRRSARGDSHTPPCSKGVHPSSKQDCSHPIPRRGHPRSRRDEQTGQGRCRQTETKHGRARRGQVSLSAMHSASSGRKMKGKKNPPATINLLFLPFQDYF